MDDQDNPNYLFPPQAIPYAVAIIVLIVLAGILLFKTVSTEVTCTRSPENLIECSLVRNTPLLHMSPVEIIDPLAVDVIQNHYDRGMPTYRAEIRSTGFSYPIFIMSSYDFDVVYGVANKINDFLLRSDDSEFYISYPGNTE